MVHYCRQKKIMEERRRKSNGKGNKFVLLLSKVCKRIEKGIAVHCYT